MRFERVRSARIRLFWWTVGLLLLIACGSVHDDGSDVAAVGKTSAAVVAGSDVTVAAQQSVELAAGTYGHIVLEDGSNTRKTILTLIGGAFVFTDIRAGDHTRIECRGACTIQVAGTVITGTKSFIGPAGKACTNPADVLLTVLGTDTATNTAIDIGVQNVFEAKASAPNGTIRIGNNSFVQADLTAQKVVLGNNVVVKPAGAPFPLDDGNACTTDTCDFTTGTAVHTPVAEGTACNDGNVCTQTDTCDASGNCVGSNPVTCTALDQCHVAGTCDPITGCSNPAKPDGTACTSLTGAAQAVCSAGFCVDVTCQTTNDSSSLFVSFDFGNGVVALTSQRSTATDGSVTTTTQITQAGQVLIAFSFVGFTNGFVTLSVDFGSGFHGISHEDFVTDGSAISGHVDGRTLLPIPFSQANDPTIVFADGNPPPKITVDSGVAQSIVAILQAVTGASSVCAPSSGTVSAGGATDPAVEPGHTEDTNLLPACISCTLDCRVSFDRCLTAVGVGVGIAAATGGPVGALIGGIAGIGAGYECNQTLNSCFDECHETGGDCCPIGCGNGCCAKGEQCLDPQKELCCSVGFERCPGRLESCFDPTVAVCLPSGEGCLSGTPTCGSGVDQICCPSGICSGSACEPLPTFGISVGITDTQTGPDICVTGTAFTAFVKVVISFVNIPGVSGAITTETRADSEGNFFLRITGFDDGFLVFCSPEQAQSTVTVVATDTTLNAIATATFPADYFCLNATVATNFNGGCR